MDFPREKIPEMLKAIRLEDPSQKSEETSAQALAERLGSLDDERKKALILSLPPHLAGEVLWKTDRASRADLIFDLDKHQLAPLFEDIPADWAADCLRLLPEEKIAQVIPLLGDRQRTLINKLLSYPPQSAGARMSPDCIPFDQNLTVDETIAIMRRKMDLERVFHCYVVDAEGRLLGVVPMRKLLVASGDTRLRDLVRSFVITVTTDMDQEEVARLATKHVIYAFPVVDAQGRLVGTITLDKVLRVIQDEATEDIYKMAGTDQREIISQSVFSVAKIRAPWLFASWMGGLGASLIIGFFEHSIARVAALAAFLPIVLGMGGNIGTQSATVVVRGLAMGYIDVKALGRTVFKEMRIGLILGITYGLLLGIFASVLHYQDYGLNLGLTVGSAILCSMFLAATMGTFVPMVLKRCNVDPAIATGPFVTTSIDILGIVAYFFVAHIFLSQHLT